MGTVLNGVCKRQLLLLHSWQKHRNIWRHHDAIGPLDRGLFLMMNYSCEPVRHAKEPGARKLVPWETQ